MDILEIAFMMIIIFFFIIYIFLTLRSKNMRTMLKMSLPMFSAGKVLNLNFKQNQNVDFDLVWIKDNQLAKEDIDHPDFYKNKEIENGTAYAESSSGKPVYVTVDGAEKTVDPARGADPALMNDNLARKLIRLGEKRAIYRLGKDKEPEKVAGMTVGHLALIVVVILIGVVFALIMNWQAMAEMGLAIKEIGGV